MIVETHDFYVSGDLKVARADGHCGCVYLCIQCDLCEKTFTHSILQSFGPSIFRPVPSVKRHSQQKGQKIG